MRPSRLRCLRILCLPLGGLAIALAVRQCRLRPVDRLAHQLQGGLCLYEAQYREWEAGRERYRCRAVSPAFSRAPFDHAEVRCRIDAARCLQEQGSAARDAVPVLIDALRNDADVLDTGDGVLELRASYAQALGLLHDERAIVPLMATLVHSSPGARSAAALALGGFGPAASVAAASLAEPLLNPIGVANCENECPSRCECSRLEANAAESLARVSPGSAKVAFTKILQEPHPPPHLRDAVLHAMAFIDGMVPPGPP